MYKTSSSITKKFLLNLKRHCADGISYFRSAIAQLQHV